MTKPRPSVFQKRHQSVPRQVIRMGSLNMADQIQNNIDEKKQMSARRLSFQPIQQVDSAQN